MVLSVDFFSGKYDTFSYDRIGCFLNQAFNILWKEIYNNVHRVHNADFLKEIVEKHRCGRIYSKAGVFLLWLKLHKQE